MTGDRDQGQGVTEHVGPDGTDVRHPRYGRTRSFTPRGGRMTPGIQRAYRDLREAYAFDAVGDRLDLGAVFPTCSQVVLEIGFGTAATTLAMAAADPDTGILACDVHQPGIGGLLRAIDDRALSQVRVVEGDAVELLEQRIAPGSLDGVRLYFPDPWPKGKHHKRRIVQPAFVDLVADRLRLGGTLHCATDWEPYAEHMLAVLRDCPRYTLDGGGFLPRPEWRPVTPFEAKGLRAGHRVHDLIARRTA